MKEEATIDGLELDPVVRDALRRLLQELEGILGRGPLKAIVYPGSDLSGPEPPSIDLFLVTDGSLESAQGLFAEATTRIREETGVHIPVHHLPSRYLEEIRRENTPFYQDLEQKGLLLTLHGAPED